MNTHDLFTQARLAYQKGDLQGAQSYAYAMLKIDTDHPPTLLLLMVIEARLKNFTQALALADRVLEVQPENPEIYINQGNIYLEVENYSLAKIAYEKAIHLLRGVTKPAWAQAYYGFAYALRRSHSEKMDAADTEKALQALSQAIACKPQYYLAYLERTQVYGDTQAWMAILADYDTMLSFDIPLGNKRDIAVNASRIARRIGAAERTTLYLQKVLMWDPHHFEAHYALAETYAAQLDFSKAKAHYEAALAANSQQKDLYGHLHLACAGFCDWQDWDARVATIESLLQKKEVAISPFKALAYIEDPALQKLTAEAWFTQKIATALPSLKQIDSVALPSVAISGRHKKIRVAYFSSDFNDHPLAILIAGLFEQHNRDEFETYAFSLSQQPQSLLLPRLKASFDHFEELEKYSTEAIVLQARRAEIDIAVDLSGYTSGGRTLVFAARAAPIQLSYLGYLGTMGSTCYDYLFADPVIVPESLQRHYSEKIAYLPSYQINDRNSIPVNKHFTRSNLGLPAEGFVFCCLNHVYKIQPKMFDAWMRILQAVPSASLCLYAHDEPTRENLRKNARDRGVDGHRLFFIGKLPYIEYLAKCRVMDLFLDTLPYNAGTTASDALWMELPVLTLAGQTFAGRIAASLLTAIGLPELITTSIEDYERMAIGLAQDKAKYAALKQKLSAQRQKTLLFNTPQMTRYIEKAYHTMYDRHCSGLAPETFYVTAD